MLVAKEGRMALNLKVSIGALLKIAPSKSTPQVLAPQVPVPLPAKPTPPASRVVKAKPAPTAASNQFDHTTPPANPSEPFQELVSSLEGQYTILHALLEVYHGRKGTLMLVNKKTGIGYRVQGVYEDGTVSLLGPNGMGFKPRVGLREVPQYEPQWR